MILAQGGYGNTDAVRAFCRELAASGSVKRLGSTNFADVMSSGQMSGGQMRGVALLELVAVKSLAAGRIASCVLFGRCEGNSSPPSRADCARWASGTSLAHQLHPVRMALLIGSVRRESVDHMIAQGEAHLRRILKSYARYYNNGVRTHRSLNKDAPVSRSVQRTGVIRSRAILGGLHHQYSRI